MIKLTPSIVGRVLLKNQDNAELPLQLSEWFGKGDLQQNIQITSAMIHILIKEKMFSEARALVEQFILSSKCLVSASDIFRALISAYSGSYVPVALCMLIKTYAQLNMIQEATEIFQKSRSRPFANNVELCNMLLKVSSKMQQPDLVIKILKEMQKRRTRPSIYSLNYVVKALLQKGKLPQVYNLIHQMHQRGTSTYASKNFIPTMPQTATVSDGIFDNTLNHGAIDKGGKLQAAKRKISGSVKRVNWHRKDVKSRINLKLLEEVIQKSLPPPVPVYQNYVVGLGYGDEIHESYYHACQMLEKGNASSYELNNFIPQMHQTGTVPDGIIDNKIDYGTTNRGGKLQVEKCKRGLTSKRSGSVKLMYKHLKNGKSKVDLKLFKEMIQKGFLPLASVYKRRDNRLCRDGKSTGSYNLSCQSMERDLVLNASTDATLIHKYLQQSNFQEAVFLMEKMLAKKILPESEIYVPFSTQLCTQGETETAEDLFHLMLNNGLVATVSDCNLLIDGYCKEEKIQKALDLQEKMIIRGLSPDIYSFKTLISALCIKGETGTAEILLNRMLEMGPSPDVAIYNNLISGYCQRGDIEAAFRIRDKMSLNGVEPDVDTYNALISGVCL